MTAPRDRQGNNMPDLADLYPGFAAHWIDTAAGKIFARAGGSGPPLLLLHGYAQTNVMWHKVAPELARHFSLVIADLPGYGWSAVPEAGRDHAPYTKRAMAAVMVELMAALGHVRFGLAGHDRGGRVAYRLALDHPGRLAKLAALVRRITVDPTTDTASLLGPKKILTVDDSPTYLHELARHDPLRALLEEIRAWE